MEGREENVLEAILEDETLEDLYDEDVDMIDAETGNSSSDAEAQQISVVESTSDKGGAETKKQKSRNKNKRRRKAKRKSKTAEKLDFNVEVTDKFILNTCRRWKEKKIHLIRITANCLGVSAVKDLVREVDTVQRCGGQLTVEGKYRTSGGILFNILKAREPKAYKEIMARGKKFEKQLWQTRNKQVPNVKKEIISPALVPTSDGTTDQVPSSSKVQPELAKGNLHGERVSVLNRLRVPVKYDDELVAEDPKEKF